MDLSKLSTKQKLIKLTLNDEETVKSFGEALDFYAYDRQPLPVYLKLASAMNSNDESSIDLIKTLILNKDGTQVMKDENILPAKVMVKAVTKIMTMLGE
jgi:hypothetical protein